MRQMQFAHSHPGRIYWSPFGVRLKMSLRLGFSVGESFAEIIGTHTGAETPGALPPVRWYLPRKSLTDGLREALGPLVEQGGELRVASALARLAPLRKSLSSVPAFFVTTGFENWLQLHAPFPKSGQTAITPLPLSEDLIFGISARQRADGSTETALASDDLQFLAAKLEMLKTKTIAVGLLHADRNPEIELQIRDYFRERGYQVFCSHAYGGDGRGASGGERERWLRAIFDAYAWAALQEQRHEIEAALGDHKEKWDIRFLSLDSEGLRLEASPGFASGGGLAEALAHAYNPGKKNDVAILQLGLERFTWIETQRDEATEFFERDAGVPSWTHLRQRIRHRPLGVQPTSPIETGFWPTPAIGPVPGGFEPGPMALGKAHHPTVFDIFFALERLEPIECVSSLVQERSRVRILESLFTLSKALPGARSLEPRTIARDLETLIIERIHEELLTVPSLREVVLAGAWARTLHPRLEARRPDMKFRLAKDAEWAEAIAARDASPTVSPTVSATVSPTVNGTDKDKTTSINGRGASR